MSPEEGYDLKKSRDAVDELYPILKDAHGNIIDGFHRLEDVQTWRVETREKINTPVKLALARIIANTHRRSVSKEERKLQLVTLAEELVKEGLAREQVIPAIVDMTTFTEQYVYKMLPDLYKKRPGAGGPVKLSLTQPHEHVADESGVKCKICGRPLTAPESVKREMGPRCAEGGKQEGSAVGSEVGKEVGKPSPPQTLTLEERAYALLDAETAKWGPLTETHMIDQLKTKLGIYLPESRTIAKKHLQRAKPTPEEGQEPEMETPPMEQPDAEHLMHCPICSNDETREDMETMLAELRESLIQSLLGEETADKVITILRGLSEGAA